MEIRIESFSNNNCYLFSKLYINNEYQCDTLEFGTLASLKENTYCINLAKNKNTGLNEIIIYDELLNKVSKLVENNKQYYKDIEMRIENSLIEVGLEVNKCRLNMCSYTFSLLLKKISKAIQFGESISFIVIRNKLVKENE